MIMAMTRTKAQERYDKKYPSITVRITKERKDQLDRYKKPRRTYSDLVLEGLSNKIKQIDEEKKQNIEMEKRTKKECEDAYQNGFEKGYNTGYEKAKKKYRSIIVCSKCDQEIEILSDSELHSIIKMICLTDNIGVKFCPNNHENLIF